MSSMTAESVFSLIAQLPPPERARLRQMMDRHLVDEQDLNGHSPQPPRDKQLPSKPMPSGSIQAMHWISAHRREYAGQWVALDGDRLIAHGPDHQEVWMAAKADGVSLPLVTFIEDPDHTVQILWP